MSDININDLGLDSVGGLNNGLESKGGVLGDVLDKGFRAALSGGGSLLSRGLGGFAGGSGGGGGGDFLSGQRELLELQAKIQAELQQITMVSNIAKSRHESRMAAVRNMKP